MTALPDLPSRGLRGVLGGILAGAVSAFMLRYSLGPPSTYVSALVHFGMLLIVMIPLFIAGLGAGAWSGLVAAVVGTAIMLVADKQMAIGYALLCAVPAALLIALSFHRRMDANEKIIWFGEGSLLSVMALYAGAVFVLVALTFHQQGGLLNATIQQMNDQIAPLKDMAGPEEYASLQTVVPVVAKTVPSIVGMSWIFFALLSMIAAQSALKQQSWQLRPDFALKNVAAPDWLIFAVAATGLAAVFAPAPFNYLGTNVCIMLCVPFFFTGLAVLHVWAGGLKLRWLLLITYYLLLSLPWTLTPVVVMTLLAGIADHWIHFRQRLASPKSIWKKGGKI